MFTFDVKRIFHGNYFIAICSATWYLSAFPLLGYHIERKHIATALILFFGTVLIYNLDRLFADHWKQVKEWLTDTVNFKWRHEKPHAKIRLQLLFLLPIFVLIPFIELKSLLRFLPAFVLAFFYAVPLGKNKLRLREQPFLKIILIALVWAWLGAVLPSRTWQEVNWQFFLSRLLFIFAITVPFDLRDMADDARKSIVTFPIRWGKTFALLLAVFSICFSVILKVLAFNEYPVYIVLLHLLPLVLIVVWAERRGWKYYLIGLDGSILLISIAHILTANVGF